MTNSRKDSYIDSIKLYIDDVKAKQAIREYTFTNPDVTYYIHFDNIDTDREKRVHLQTGKMAMLLLFMTRKVRPMNIMLHR